MIEYKVKVDYCGTKRWYLNDQLHREDGPAIEYGNGTKIWHKHGRRHREDGPAIERADGTKEWYLNGKKHREDGPAVEEANGNKQWWLNSQSLSKEKWENKTQYHTVTIDGKQIKISKESYQNLKQVIGE